MDFDERDLFEWAERAGFSTVKLNLEAEQRSEPRTITNNWETLLRISGNPLSPTLGETIDAALSEEETTVLEGHLQPLVEAGEGSSRLACAYLTAVK